MPDFPLLGGQRYLGAANTGASEGTAITPSATAHTKGSYTALFTAATNTTGAQGVLLVALGTDIKTDYLLDFSLGAAASEQVVAANLLVSAPDLFVPAMYYLPISLPSGVRIACRCQAGGTSKSALKVMVALLNQGLAPSQPLSKVAAYGAITGTTQGTSVDPGGTANTKGSWVELTSSTSANHSALIVAIGNQQQTSRSTTPWLVDIGIGAAGSEVVVLPNLYVLAHATTNFALGPSAFPPLWLEIPEGTRIAARAQCSINTATVRLIDVACYGIG